MRNAATKRPRKRPLESSGATITGKGGLPLSRKAGQNIFLPAPGKAQNPPKRRSQVTLSLPWWPSGYFALMGDCLGSKTGPSCPGPGVNSGSIGQLITAPGARQGWKSVLPPSISAASKLRALNRSVTLRQARRARSRSPAGRGVGAPQCKPCAAAKTKCRTTCLLVPHPSFGVTLGQA